MPQIPNIEKFDFRLRQHEGYCVPATIQVVSNYLNPELKITQDDILQRYESHEGCTLANIGLESVKREVLDKEPKFKWCDSEYIPQSSLKDFKSYLARIKASIDSGIPHIISVRIPRFVQHGFRVFRGLTQWHMITVVGYEDEKTLEVYNPQPIPELGDHSVVEMETLRSWLTEANSGKSEVTDSLVMRRK